MLLTYRNNILVVRKHLFWDIKAENIKPLKNKRLIIERIVTRGNLDEFVFMNHFYSKETIKKVIVKIGSLDKKTLNNLSVFYNIDKNQFKCTKKLLKGQHWNSSENSNPINH